MIKQALILAGGNGTRFGNTTKIYPKEMLPINQIPAMELIIDELISEGINNITIVINPKKLNIKNYFNEEYQDKKNITINFVIQEKVGGTGKTLLLCKEYIKDDYFLLIYGDDLFINKEKSKTSTKEMIDAFNKYKTNILGTIKVLKEQVSLYGIVTLDENNKVLSIVEKPKTEEALSLFASMGRYILNKDIIKVLEEIDKTHDQSKELFITTAFEKMFKCQSFYAAFISCQRFDLGTYLGFIKANLYAIMLNSAFKEEISTFMKEVENENY